MRPLVEQYLGLGSSSSQLMGYVENVNAAALGSAGGAFLLITVISTMGTVEQALNTIFNVPQSRSYFRKFSDYLSVLFTVPFLIVAALGVTAVFSVRISQFPFVTQLLPYLFVWAGFFFLFVFFPYTKVRYGPGADRFVRDRGAFSARAVGLRALPGGRRQLPGNLRRDGDAADFPGLDLHRVVGDSVRRRTDRVGAARRHPADAGADVAGFSVFGDDAYPDSPGGSRLSRRRRHHVVDARPRTLRARKPRSRRFSTGSKPAAL